MDISLKLGLLVGLVISAVQPSQAQGAADSARGLAAASDKDSRAMSCDIGRGRGRTGFRFPIWGNDDDMLRVVGLTHDQRLICFREDKPGEARVIGTVSGLQGDSTLVGIDFRVQDGKLYGVGNQGGVYVFEPNSGVPILVNRLTVALDGTAFGVDFNPAADRLRIVSDKGQNLRHNVNAGGVTLQDDPLDYPPAAQLNSIGPTALAVAGSAYTNNDLSPTTGTTLYALDSNLDQVSIQLSPNDGTLGATGMLTVDTSPQVGFDIYSTLREGVATGNRGLAALTTGNGVSSLYGVVLSTGKATARGHFAQTDQVIGIAIPLDQD
jgi:hypothetical protein